MKRFAIAAACLLLATSAFAETKSVSESGSVSQSQSGSQSGVSINTKGTKNVPSAIAPGLSASGLSCSGSASIGSSGGGWGLSFGMTKEDAACNAREDAKYIHGVTGSQGAAKERLCEQKLNREAFRRAGQPCVADQRVSNVAQTPVVRRSFKNMRQCRAYAATHPGVLCRSQ